MDSVCKRREMEMEGTFLRPSVRQGLLQRTCSQRYYQQVLSKDKCQSGVNFTVSFMPPIQVGKMANAENRSVCTQFYEGSTKGESTSAPYYRSHAKDRLLWLGCVQKLKIRQAFQLPSLGLFSAGIGQPLLDLAAVGVPVKTIVPPHF
jgi:hypothetical protein